MNSKTTALKPSIKKYDKIWSKLVRERDDFRCQVCKKQSDYVHAHHFFRRGIKSTRYELDNGITLCFQCHTANHNFSAHRTPEAFERWFKTEFPERHEAMKTKTMKMMSERLAINEFIISQNSKEPEDINQTETH